MGVGEAVFVPSPLLREVAGFEPAVPGAGPKRPKAARKTPDSDFYSGQRGIPRDRMGLKPGARAVESTGPHAVRTARSRLPAPARLRAPLTRSWKILTIKERASACPGGIASTCRSWTPRRGVCCRRPLRGARATLRMPALSLGPGVRPHGWCPAAAPPLPGRVDWSWSVLGEVGAQAQREGERSDRSGEAPSRADAGGAPRP